MEGVVLYVALVKVFVDHHLRYVIAFTIASYGNGWYMLSDRNRTSPPPPPLRLSPLPQVSLYSIWLCAFLLGSF